MAEEVDWKGGVEGVGWRIREEGWRGGRLGRGGRRRWSGGMEGGGVHAWLHAH